MGVEFGSKLVGMVDRLLFSWCPTDESRECGTSGLKTRIAIITLSTRYPFSINSFLGGDMGKGAIYVTTLLNGRSDHLRSGGNLGCTTYHTDLSDDGACVFLTTGPRRLRFIIREDGSMGCTLEERIGNTRWRLEDFLPPPSSEEMSGLVKLGEHLINGSRPS